MQTTEYNDYAGQDVEGSNERGCPYVGQTGATAVNDFSAVLAALGFSSVEEMLAAAQAI